MAADTLCGSISLPTARNQVSPSPSPPPSATIQPDLSLGWLVRSGYWFLSSVSPIYTDEYICRGIDGYMYLLIYIFISYTSAPMPPGLFLAGRSKANLYCWNILPGRSWRWPLIHCAVPFPYQRPDTSKAHITLSRQCYMIA